MLPVFMDLALRPSDVLYEIWPYLLIGAIVVAAIVVSIVLIVKFARKKK